MALAGGLSGGITPLGYAPNLGQAEPDEARPDVDAGQLAAVCHSLNRGGRAGQERGDIAPCDQWLRPRRGVLCCLMVSHGDRIPPPEMGLLQIVDESHADAYRRSLAHYTVLLGAVVEAYFQAIEQLDIEWDSDPERAYRSNPRIRRAFAGYDLDPVRRERSGIPKQLFRDAIWYVRDALGLCIECGAAAEPYYEPVTGVESLELVCGHVQDIETIVSTAVCRLGQAIGADPRRQR
jgi:hypothetical protein